MAKFPRNKPCPCGSGKKFKKCHGRVDMDGLQFGADRRSALPAADDVIRVTQQGRGRPIIATKFDETQFVAVGSGLHWSKKWKTFPDFLSDYLKHVLGRDWGNAEIAKPFQSRHPILQWYDLYCEFQKREIKSPGEVHSSKITGVVGCYLGLAYSLYLLDHNVELQSRLVSRLKNIGNFQGAYYELIVANLLLRAGFRLELEDETDTESKHCEFAATSEATGKRYWVEAKMRSVAGLLGRTDADGGVDRLPISQLIPHLNAALKKPAKDERLIFIDVNAASSLGANSRPDWTDRAYRRLERFEEERDDGATAYVFVTNMAFHRQLNAEPQIAAIAFGLGYPDFNRGGYIRLSDLYRQKKKHIDAHIIGDLIEKYLRFPTTFDGKLPSESFGRPSSRVVIGRSYSFQGPDGQELKGVVTAAIADELNRRNVVAVMDEAGRGHLLQSPMSDKDLEEYREFGEAYFGEVTEGPRKPKDEFELFEWLMAAQKGYPREKILDWFSAAPYLSELKKLSDEDLLMAYCEAMVSAIVSRRKRQNPKQSE